MTARARRGWLHGEGSGKISKGDSDRQVGRHCRLNSDLLMNEFQDFELRRWEQSAAAYDRYFTPLTLQALAAIVENGRLGSGVRVLDVACGPGHLSRLMHDAGAITVGVDFSKSMVTLARETYPGLAFEIGDAQNLDFAAGTFDAVVMNFGILHLASPEKAIAEAYRVLGPGGRFVMTIWGQPEASKGFEIILGAIAKADVASTLPEGPPFFQFSDDDVADRALRQAGFAEVHIDEVIADWVLPDADVLFQAFFDGTARTGGLLRTMDEAALAVVRAATVLGAQPFARQDGVHLPMSIKIITGLRD